MRFSIRNIGVSLSLLVAAIVVVNAMMATSQSLKQDRLARMSVEIAEVLDASYKALIPLSLERSVTQVGLSLEEPLPAQFRNMIDQQRRSSNTALDALRRRLTDASLIPEKTAFLAELDGAVEKAAALRREADAAFAVRDRSARPTPRSCRRGSSASSATCRRPPT